MKNILLEKKLQSIVSKVLSESEDPKKELKDAYEKLKKVRKELKELGKKNSDLKKYKTTMRELSDQIEEMEDDEMFETESEGEDEVIQKNEKSECYGTFKGLGLKESYIRRIVRKKIKEDDDDLTVVNFVK